jgi:Fe2+ or Zn2+ uptake regulation protein
MIVCSCLVITDEDIERAVLDILSLPDAPLPTPGIVYRHLRKKMVCCGCSPLAVSTIYDKIDQLAEKGVVCPYACANAQGRLLKCASDTPAQKLIEHAPIVRRRRKRPVVPPAKPALAQA